MFKHVIGLVLSLILSLILILSLVLSLILLLSLLLLLLLLLLLRDSVHKSHFSSLAREHCRLEFIVQIYFYSVEPVLKK